MHTLRQYLTTMDDPQGLTRTLGEVIPCRDRSGRLRYHTGNSAVVFRVRCDGRDCALRGYFHHPPHLREIYGERLHEKALYLFEAPDRGEWVDVVLDEWIEGEPFDQAIRRAARDHDRNRLSDYSARFDRLAAALTADEWAHGDLKPENILLTPLGELRLIDFDARFLPAFAGRTSPELGTAAYQHPARRACDFDAHLDDYPAALISTALAALAEEPALFDRYGKGDGLLFTPHRAAADPALAEVLALFEARGMALRYRIARLLRAPYLRLRQLPDWLALTQRTPCAGLPSGTPPELFVDGGYWGYRNAGKVVVPPLYDGGLEFSEGVAAVCVGHSWHYIDTTGRVVLSCPGCSEISPFRDGKAFGIRNGERITLRREGGGIC